jgi:hypothetical protein
VCFSPAGTVRDPTQPPPLRQWQLCSLPLYFLAAAPDMSAQGEFLSRSAILDWSVGWGSDTRDFPAPDAIWSGLIALLLFTARLWHRQASTDVRTKPLGTDVSIFLPCLLPVYDGLTIAFVGLAVFSGALYAVEEVWGSGLEEAPSSEPVVPTIVLSILVGIRMLLLELSFVLLGMYFGQAIPSRRSLAKSLPLSLSWGVLCGLATALVAQAVQDGWFPDDTSALVLALSIACVSATGYIVLVFCLGFGRPALRVWACGVVSLRLVQCAAIAAEVIPGSFDDSPTSAVGLIVDLVLMVVMVLLYTCTMRRALIVDVEFWRLISRDATAMNPSLRAFGVEHTHGYTTIPPVAPVVPGEAKPPRGATAREQLLEDYSREALTLDHVDHFLISNTPAALVSTAAHILVQRDAAKGVGYADHEEEAEERGENGRGCIQRLQDCLFLRSYSRYQQALRWVGPGPSPAEGRAGRMPYLCELCCRPQVAFHAERLVYRRHIASAAVAASLWDADLPHVYRSDVRSRLEAAQSESRLLSVAHERGRTASGISLSSMEGEGAPAVVTPPRSPTGVSPARKQNSGVSSIVGPWGEKDAGRSFVRSVRFVEYRSVKDPSDPAHKFLPLTQRAARSLILEVESLTGSKVFLPLPAEPVTLEEVVRASAGSKWASKLPWQVLPEHDTTVARPQGLDGADALLRVLQSANGKNLDFALLRQTEVFAYSNTCTVFSGWYNGLPVVSKRFAEDSPLQPLLGVALVAREAAYASLLPPSPRICQFLGLVYSPPDFSLIYQRCPLGSLETMLVSLWRAQRAWKQAAEVLAAREDGSSEGTMLGDSPLDRFRARRLVRSAGTELPVRENAVPLRTRRSGAGDKEVEERLFSWLTPLSQKNASRLSIVERGVPFGRMVPVPRWLVSAAQSARAEWRKQCASFPPATAYAAPAVWVAQSGVNPDSGRPNADFAKVLSNQWSSIARGLPPSEEDMLVPDPCLDIAPTSLAHTTGGSSHASFESYSRPALPTPTPASAPTPVASASAAASAEHTEEDTDAVETDESAEAAIDAFLGYAPSADGLPASLPRDEVLHHVAQHTGLWAGGLGSLSSEMLDRAVSAELVSRDKMFEEPTERTALGSRSGGYGTYSSLESSAPSKVLSDWEATLLCDVKLAMSLTWPMRLRMAVDCAEAVATIHQTRSPAWYGPILGDRPLVHRDLKPANFFVNERLGVCVGDFGEMRALPLGSALNASVQRDYSTDELAATRTVAVGTRPFQSPEIRLDPTRMQGPTWKGERDLSLHEMLDVVLPWTAESRERLVPGSPARDRDGAESDLDDAALRLFSDCAPAADDGPGGRATDVWALGQVLAVLLGSPSSTAYAPPLCVHPQATLIIKACLFSDYRLRPAAASVAKKLEALYRDAQAVFEAGAPLSSSSSSASP